GSVAELGARQPEQIDKAHKNHPYRNYRHPARVFLDVLPQQDEKGNKEVEDKNNDGDDSPLSIQARIKKGNFFRLVTRPNDQQLREAEVSPQHDKCKEELSEVVEVSFLEDGSKWLGLGHHDEQRYHERHRGNQLTGYVEKSINRGCPMG